MELVSKQQISVCMSNFLPVVSGVTTTGSILVPDLFFLIFISNLITSQLLEFADNTKCFRLSTLNFSKKTSVATLFDWTVNNFLSFNLSKFVFMSFHRHLNSSYNVNGYAITEFSRCKDLGIVFTNSLTWQDHYEMISYSCGKLYYWKLFDAASKYCKALIK